MGDDDSFGGLAVKFLFSNSLRIKAEKILAG